MSEFITDKIQLNNTNQTWVVNRRNESMFRKFMTPQAVKEFNIELIELSDITNPSNLEIEFLVNSYKRRLIKLYRFRTDFIFQNNFFILNTEDRTDFQFEFPDARDPEFEFSIKITSNEDFNITIYYSTDQIENQSLYESI